MEEGHTQDEHPQARLSRRRAIQRTAAALAAPFLAPRATVTAQSATPAVPVATLAPVPTLPFGTSPQHGSRTASPHTTLAFRGITAQHLGELRVEGSVTGGHSGTIVEHPDRAGASWLPDGAFEPGEYVWVAAAVPLSTNPDGRLAFRVATPAQRITVEPEPLDPEPQEDDDRFHTYVSRPDLSPPRMIITTEPTGTAPGYIFLTPTTPWGSTGRAIIDEQGEPVWIGAPAQRTHGNFCLEVGHYRGQPVLAWWEGAKTVGYGFGHWVLGNSAYETVATIRAGNGLSGLDVHEIILTERGTAYTLSYTPIEWNLSTVGGGYRRSILDGVIQEIEIETGLVLWEWHALDHIRVSESYQGLPRDAGIPWDYIHLNALSLDVDGNLLLSARHTHASYKVDATTGKLLWRLGGKASDVEMGPQTSFAYHHDTQRQPDGTISIFDNADNQDGTTGAQASRALFLDLDESAMRASVAREIVHETEILSVSQGNVQRLPNGNLLVGWGSAPVFTEYTAAGEMIYNARFPRGTQSYRALRFPWEGRPTTPPDVAVQRAAGGAIRVYVSWNGATEVAQWRVRGGRSAEDADALATAERAGFETEILLDADVSWITVEALDATGFALGSSVPVQVR